MRETAGKASLRHLSSQLLGRLLGLFHTSGAGVMDQPTDPCNITYRKFPWFFKKKKKKKKKKKSGQPK
jgi:hypothetical protein